MGPGLIANPKSQILFVLISPVEPVSMNISCGLYSLTGFKPVGIMKGTLVDDRIGIIKIGDDSKYYIIGRPEDPGNNGAIAPGDRITIYGFTLSSTIA